MRNLKFRAWDKKRGEWYGESNPEILTFKGFAIFGECTLLCTPLAGEMQYLEITEFTGLKDKNGKEIYESDLVKCCIDSECSIHQVIWGGETNSNHYPAFDLAPYVEVESNGISYFSEAGTIEVVGNIYED